MTEGPLEDITALAGLLLDRLETKYLQESENPELLSSTHKTPDKINMIREARSYLADLAEPGQGGVDLRLGYDIANRMIELYPTRLVDMGYLLR